MKKHRTIYYLCIFAVSILSFDVMAELNNPHNVVENKNDTCTQCHHDLPDIKIGLNTKNQRVDLSQFKQDGIKMCTDCHSEKEGHVVGVSLDFSVPADLPLGQNKTISCLTCHYTHGDLKSDRPQSSYSVIDRLLDSERLHKSFLIRRNNSHGELCLTCHNTEQSKKNE